MKRITILFLIVIITFLFTLSAFALTKEERAWKEDILTLLSLVKRVGDYSEVVDLIEVAPALKKDQEIRKAFITFAPPGATPPEWAREEKIATAKTQKEKERREMKEKKARRITQGVVAQKEEPAPPVIIEIPEKIAIAEAPKEKKRSERGEEARPLTKEKKKEVRKYYLIGKRYYNAKEDKKAIEEFKKVLALDPGHQKAIRYLSESHYHLGRKYYRDKDYGKAMAEFEKVLAKNPEHKKAKEYFAKARNRIGEVPKAVEVPPEKIVEEAKRPPIEIIEEKRARAEEEARRIALEVTAQKREAAPPVRIEVPEKIATVETTEKVSPEGQAYGAGRWESEQVSREEQRIRPTPLPKGAKVIHSTDVVSGVRAEMVQGKMRVTITLSGERKYTVSERSRPPALVIDIPHTINAVFPGRVMVNQGGVRMVEIIQYRTVPFDETRVIIRLSRFKEYEIKSKGNKIYVEFEE